MKVSKSHFLDFGQNREEFKAVDDASGRYSTGWFWGNQYWTGSQTLCNNIASKKTSSILISSAKPKESSVATAPFGVLFFMVHLRINISVSPKVCPNTNYIFSQFFQNCSTKFLLVRIRNYLNTAAPCYLYQQEQTLHIGLCLPYTCTDSDVREMVRHSVADTQLVRTKLVSIRSPHQHYDVWQDRTFRILCGVTVAVAFFLLVGTALDVYVEYVTVMASTDNSLMHKFNHDNQTRCDDGRLYNGSGSPVKGGFLRDALLAFSLRANIRTICNRTNGVDTIPVLHGLKLISMTWVILGHTCIVAFKYSDNQEYRKVVQKELLFQTITNGTFSVDTFFFVSGVLVSFLYFRTNANGKLDRFTNGRNHWWAVGLHFSGLILYRFIRLTAPYLFTLGVVAVVMKWFNYNAIFEPPTQDHVNCPAFWWRNILYINTLFPVKEMCMLWSWYLSDDTQFYVIGAVMLILATRKFKTAACIVAVFMISSWLTTGYIAFDNRHIPGSDDPLALFDKIYDKPWTRFGPYLIGMCVGWYLFRSGCQLGVSRKSLLLGWTASLCTLLALIYGLHEAELTPLAGAVYSSLSHSMWAGSLAWIVIVCATGHGGPVNAILSSTLLYPFSRVTYCAYLVHPLVIRAMAMCTDHPFHLGGVQMVIVFFGQVVASFTVAFCVSLAFEAPIVSLLRVVSRQALGATATTSTVPTNYYRNNLNDCKKPPTTLDTLVVPSPMV